MTGIFAYMRPATTRIGHALEACIFFLLLRLVYTIGAFCILAAGSGLLLGFLSGGRRTKIPENPHTPGLLLFEPVFWWFLLALSVLAGLFGPWLYDRRVLRGRGELAEDRHDDAWIREFLAEPPPPTTPPVEKTRPKP